MTSYETIVLWFSFFVSVFTLIAGGWVRIRDYFKDKAQKKADAIEAEIQSRLKAAQTANVQAPEAMAAPMMGW
ncbi:DUF1378 family protein [Pantoea sp. App145]|uniref:DUF1378 family protein n=1 Tax=Pantoea sp. App145 TaxID=3071567 RepID=UPI003A803D09